MTVRVLNTERWNAKNTATEITFVSLWRAKLKEFGENSPCGEKQGCADGALYIYECEG